MRKMLGNFGTLQIILELGTNFSPNIIYVIIILYIYILSSNQFLQFINYYHILLRFNEFNKKI